MINEEKQLDCSVILPVFYNADSLKNTMLELRNELVIKDASRSYEFIFVDDGSGDNSLKVLEEIYHEFPDLVRVVKLTRNFGQIPAVIAGFGYATGKSVVMVSADGQDPISLIPEMLEQRDAGHEVVIACRSSRDEGIGRTIPSRIFYSVMQKLCFENMPRGGFDYVCLSSRAKKFLLESSESHAFIQGQILSLGLRPVFIPYRRRARNHGISRWNFSRKITYLLDGVLNYSFFPLRMMVVIGVFCSCIGFVYSGFVIGQRLFAETPVEGWASLMVIILVLGGVQMMMLGIIGEYLWRVLAQVHNRKLFLVDRCLPNTLVEACK